MLEIEKTKLCFSSRVKKKQLQLVPLHVKAASSLLPSSHIQLLCTETHKHLGKLH